MKTRFITGLLCIMILGLARSQVINIPADYPSIQQGINAASDGDTVLVASGTYVENISFNGKAITVASHYLTTQDESYIDQTIIDGGGITSVVTFNDDEDTSSVLCGFTITNGKGGMIIVGSPLEYAGGIRCLGASPKLRNLNVKENQYGGVSTHMGSDAILSSLTVLENELWGIWCEAGEPVLSDLTVSGNTGPGIRFSYSDATLSNAVITGNTYMSGASASGGGIDCSDASPVLENVTIKNNLSRYGGGLDCYGYSYPVLKNVTIAHNTATIQGGGIRCYVSAPVFDENLRCNVYSNEAPEGNDFFSEFLDQVVILDTFSVMNPTDYYAEPLQFFDFDIQQGKKTLVDADLFVSPNGDDENSGLNDDEPLKTIRCAFSRIMADPEHRNTVHLLPGTYSPLTNQEQLPVQLIDHLHLSGASASLVKIDAMGQTRVLQMMDNLRSVIDGLTIKNGIEDGIRIMDCTDPQISNTIIMDNTGSYGGGLAVGYSDVTLKNVVISGNYATNTGGGIFCTSANPRLINVTIADNYCGYQGGGMSCYGNSNPVLINTIVWDNHPGQIWFHDSNVPNSIFVEYSDIEGGQSGIIVNQNLTVHWLDGNIAMNPVFSLTSPNPCCICNSSPCIDKGTPDTTGLHLPLYDLTGCLRVCDGNDDDTAVIDMGAYEFTPLSVGLGEMPRDDDEMDLEVFPNPTGGVSDFRFQISDFRNVSIKIYDLNGKEMAIVVDKQLSPGEHTFKYDTGNLAPGIYIILKSEINHLKSEINKLVVVR